MGQGREVYIFSIYIKDSGKGCWDGGKGNGEQGKKRNLALVNHK